MAEFIASLNAYKYLRGSMSACSWEAGWRSLLLRAYDDPAEVEEFTTPPTSDHLIVLVVDGSCNVEGRYRDTWQSANYKVGSLGMTAPGHEVTLRWRGTTRHSNLQLHIPEATIRGAFEELADRNVRLSEMPNTLFDEDPLIGRVMLSLSEAMAESVPDLYAETTAHMLTTHLLVRHAKVKPRPTPKQEDLRLKRVDEFMRENLCSAISLDTIARVAGISRFHLVRLFKQNYDETPFKRLTRLRIEEAQGRLLEGQETVTEIAFACGYENPAHFASAFRRLVGVPPSLYRQKNR